MLIRQALFHDIPGLEALEKKSFRAIDRWDIIDMVNYTLKHHGHCRVVEIDDKVAGSIWITSERGTHYIVSIAVDKQYRNRGIGRKLVDDLVRNSFMYGWKVRLHVREDNTTAIKMYLKNGFKKVRKVKDYYRDHAPAIIYEYNPLTNE